MVRRARECKKWAKETSGPQGRVKNKGLKDEEGAVLTDQCLQMNARRDSELPVFMVEKQPAKTDYWR